MNGISLPGRSDIEARLWRLPPACSVTLPVSRRIGIKETVDRLCPMSRCPGLSHGSVVEFLVLHLLHSPYRQPLYRLEEWAEEFSAERIYRVESSAFNDDRIGRALDAISESVAEIETAVVTEALCRFDIDVRAIHWDLTHVTFAGGHDDFEDVSGGYGGGRLHEHQLKVSLHATSEGGVPVRHEIVPGKAHQAPYAPAMLADLAERLGRSDLIVLSDRAGISYDILAAYRHSGAHAVGPLQATAAELETLAGVPIGEFAELSYRAPSAKDAVYRYHETTLTIERQKQPEPLEVRALFVHSSRRESDDAASRQKALDKAIARLGYIESKLNARRYAKRDYAKAQVDKAVPESLRDAIHPDLSGEDRALSLTWSVDEEAFDELGKLDGRYIVIADVDDLSPDEIFALFKRQNVIEQRFRALKNDLNVEPIWLHNEERIRAMLLVFLLSLIVYTLIELSSERAGLSTKRYHKMTARELIHAFGVVDLIELRVRGAPTQWQLQISEKQARLLQRLKLPMPTNYINTD